MRHAETYYKSTWDGVVLVLAAILALALVMFATKAAGAETPVPQTELVVSPWSGVFHAVPSEGGTAYVEVGSRVTSDTVVGIVSLDIMRPDCQVEVFAGINGTLVEILVSDATFVDAGQPLMVMINPMGKTIRVGGYFSPSSVPENALLYRIPDLVELKVILGEQALSTHRISIYQSGHVLTTPIH